MDGRYQDNLLIAGMGRTGNSVAGYFDFSGIEYLACDDHADYPDCKESMHDFHGYVIKSPGIARGAFPVSEDVRVINDIELFMRICTKPAIMVTGTNGKSTVVALLEQMLVGAGAKAVACGNNGLPVFQAMSKDIDLYVLELSSYQLENMLTLSSAASVLLNIGVDHVDRYSNMQEYMSFKQKIYTNSRVSVYPVNSVKEIEYQNDIHGYMAVHGQEKTVYHSDGKNILRNGVEYCNVSGLSLSGSHNYLNVCAALALVDRLSLDQNKVVAALQGFSGLPHRMETVCYDSRGRKWINDSKSTNAHSLRAALQSRSDPVCLIAGGRGKDEDYHEVFEDYSGVIARLILFGEDAGVIDSQAANIDDRIIVETLQQAVQHVADFQGDILFSPACASFDQYRDYEARGEDFRNLAKRVASC